MLNSYSRRQRRNASRYPIAHRATISAKSRIITSALYLSIEAEGQSTKGIVKDKSANNASITSRERSENTGFGRRDQNQKMRESSESLTSTKLRFASSGSENGGNSSYFQSGSAMRSLHIPAKPSFRTSTFPFTALPLVPAPSMRSR